MYQLSVYEALEHKDALLIDTRSPKEYAESHIPNAINIPIFDNKERELVGTNYKQKGSNDAINLGIEILSKKLPELMDEFFQYKKKKLIIYCARGGMRSKSIVNILDIFDFDVAQLIGGYKAYRNHVLEYFKGLKFKPKLICLHGLTGAGKTELLQELNPMIDLEGLASHRGSLLGNIKLHPKGQKMFDALLMNELKKVKDEKFVFIEGESKRIGRIQIPDTFYAYFLDCINVNVLDSMENRVKRINQEYMPLNKEETDYVLSVLIKIKQKISNAIADKLKEKLISKDYESFIKIILETYYDPIYTKTLSKNKYDYTIDQNNEPIKHLMGIVSEI